jgi:hypothetical protein
MHPWSKRDPVTGRMTKQYTETTCGHAPYFAKGLCVNCYYRNPANNSEARRRRRGMTKAAYLELIEPGICHICGKRCGSYGRVSHIDHDHQTGQVRGLLCAGCNRLVGEMERLFGAFSVPAIAVGAVTEYLGMERS